MNHGNTDNQNEAFEFTYSAKQQEEVQKIRRKYAPAPVEEDKMEQLRRLDAGVTKKGSAAALILGIVSALLLGVGMSCCMVWGGSLFIPGIIVGVIGLVGAALAYPLYNRITKKEREKIAPEILRLTDELMK